MSGRRRLSASLCLLMNRESELLKEWKLEAAVPTSFNSTVWRRIEDRRQVSVTEAVRAWAAGLFAKRAVVASYFTLTVAIGLAAAHVQSSRVLNDRAEQLEARYVQSVDPYARPFAP